MGKIKIYKPGQIITIEDEDNKLRQFRIVKHPRARTMCIECDLSNSLITMSSCMRYCARRHNDWKRNSDGYVLKEIQCGDRSVHK